MNQKRYFINNIDINIITEKPKIGKYRNKITHSIASLCNINNNQINIKGKTTEKLGFIGKEEGVACHAIVLVQKV